VGPSGNILISHRVLSNLGYITKVTYIIELVHLFEDALYLVWFVKLKQSLKPIAKLVQMANFCACAPPQETSELISTI